MNRRPRVYVSGHRGMVGSAIVRNLEDHGYDDIVVRSREQLDLCKEDRVADFFRSERPEIVLMAAAWVGGIAANIRSPVQALENNLRIQTNVIRQAHAHGVQKLIFIGSSCMYPRLCSQPMSESQLLSGPLEPTNEGYAIAKLTGWKLCEAYRQQYGLAALTTVPPNLYGPNDNFDPQTGHVVASLIHRFHEAKVSGNASVTVWGTGRARREFMHVDDNADATRFLLELGEAPSITNVGTGTDVSIAELSRMVADAVGYKGKIVFDASRPDGMPQKLMDNSRLTKLGWTNETPIKAGLDSTYRWYIDHLEGHSP